MLTVLSCVVLQKYTLFCQSAIIHCRKYEKLFSLSCFWLEIVILKCEALMSWTARGVEREWGIASACSLLPPLYLLQRLRWHVEAWKYVERLNLICLTFKINAVFNHRLGLNYKPSAGVVAWQGVDLHIAIALLYIEAGIAHGGSESLQSIGHFADGDFGRVVVVAQVAQEHIF